jgi:hypothetical protein
MGILKPLFFHYFRIPAQPFSEVPEPLMHANKRTDRFQVSSLGFKAYSSGQLQIV